MVWIIEFLCIHIFYLLFWALKIFILASVTNMEQITSHFGELITIELKQFIGNTAAETNQYLL